MYRSVSVMGLGNFGLSLALTYCSRGLRVIGVDVDELKIKRLSRDDLELDDLVQGGKAASLRRYLNTGRLVMTTRPALAAWETTAYIVTFPEDNQLKATEQQYFTRLLKQLGLSLKLNDLIIVNALSDEGLLQETLIPVLECSSRMIAGQDFHVAHTLQDATFQKQTSGFTTADVTLKGLTETCSAKAMELFGQLTSGDIHVAGQFAE
jgi:UDP-N-acetyl-D-mannosaminuronate dehydrogenase